MKGNLPDLPVTLFQGNPNPTHPISAVSWDVHPTPSLWEPKRLAAAD